MSANLTSDLDKTIAKGVRNDHDAKRSPIAFSEAITTQFTSGSFAEVLAAEVVKAVTR